MSTKPATYSYVLAPILGLAAFFITAINATEPLSITLALVFLFAGGLFGFLWPNQSWRWGLWIAGPMVGLLALSVLFAGQLDVFLKKDLPPLLLAITAACLGSFISAWYKRRRKDNRKR